MGLDDTVPGEEAMNSDLGRQELLDKLDKLERENAQYLTNLTSTQGRCTELIQELRATRREPLVLTRVLAKVIIERELQNQKWGRVYGTWGNDIGTKLAVLMEEVGEVANAALKASDDAHLDENDHVHAELVQVAAVAIAWLETFEKDE